jgi:hypothetical protein
VDCNFVSDIDECLSSNVCPPNAKCSNTNGSFHCECSSGFEQNDDVCVDVDECHSGIADCAHYERCENTVGSYRCMCNAGFAHINGSCVGTCAQFTTSDHLTFIQTLTNATPPHFATTTRAVLIFPAISDASATQDSLAAAFSVSVLSLNTLNCFVRLNILDVDECATNKSSCAGRNEHCINVPGYFDCLCDRGYEKIGDNCEDIDECNNSALHRCPNTTICLNSPGSFACECVEGYTGSSDNCAGRSAQCDLQFS